MHELIYYLNDHVIEVDKFYDEVDGSYINSATVTVTLVDSTGTDVVGQTWPTALPYVASSDGKYRATLADTMTLVKGQPYTAKVTANGGPGLMGYWEVPVKVVTRNS